MPFVLTITAGYFSYLSKIALFSLDRMFFIFEKFNNKAMAYAFIFIETLCQQHTLILMTNEITRKRSMKIWHLIVVLADEIERRC